MRLVIQRVRRAAVEVDGAVVAAIGQGLLVLAGVARGDGREDAERSARKIRELRLFSDEHGRMNLDLAAVGGAVLAVSQFTLVGSIDKGRRPSFDDALEPGAARVLFDALVGHLASAGVRVATGVFGADMQVSLVNDGPVTFIYDSRKE